MFSNQTELCAGVTGRTLAPPPRLTFIIRMAGVGPTGVNDIHNLIFITLLICWQMFIPLSPHGVGREMSEQF